MLRFLGHENVATRDGGWPAWLAAGGAAETGVRSASVTAAQAVQSLEPSAVAAMPAVDAQAVLANLENPSFTAVDALAANRYRVETEPIDPVAGPIPGALNTPTFLNFGYDGRFQAPAALGADV